MPKRLTTEEFIKRSVSVHGDKYDYSLVNYTNNYTKVKIICPIHGVFEQNPKSHLKGQGCSIYYGNIKKTTEEFIIDAKKIHGDKYDYSFVEYINNKTKVKIICPIHGIFEQSPNMHTKGQGCLLCSGKNKKTTSAFITEAKKIHGDKYDYSLVEYKNTNTKIKIICPIHGMFEQIPKSHLKGHICLYCSKNMKDNKDSFIIKSNNVHGYDKYDYTLVDYKNTLTKVKIICPEHGIFEQLPNSHLSNHGCPKCFGNYQKNTEQFINEAKEVHENKYDYSSVNYIGNKIKVKIICPIHGIFEQKPIKHLYGQGCPTCRESKGEMKITQFLNDNNFIYKEQYRFNDCRNILPLPFDFYLPELKTCIEYDGKQHFNVVKHWGGEKALVETQKRDQIKNKYCLKNNIKLLRIKYTEMNNIDSIISEFLIKNN